ncbi:hypothetical protein [Bdellovibrio bacteriovorus]|uniref:hypothetical protein n=1 Tax=Bdellovibrio bacteriovorus TaxID=959 RepID=UPI0035A61F05
MKWHWVFTIFFLSVGLPASGHVFKNVQGNYQILSCENLSPNPSFQERLCDFKTMTVLPNSFGTALYFAKCVEGYYNVRSFGLPENTEDWQKSRYVEQGSGFASFIREGYKYYETFILRRTHEDNFILTLQTRSEYKNPHYDAFEITLKKTSNKPDPMPITGGPGPDTCEE